LNLQQYHRPTSRKKALALLNKNPGSVVPLAGGTYLVASAARQVTEVVDITHLKLNFIRRGKGTIRVGATTTLQELADSSEFNVVGQGLLAEASRMTTVSRMRRNVSTIGGEIVVAAPSSSVPVALLAFDARIKIVGDATREILLADFYLADRQQQLHGAIITEVMLPNAKRKPRTALVRLAQIPSSIPIIQVATWVETKQGLCELARIAIDAATATPTRFPSAEALLTGRPLDDESINAAAEEVAAAIHPVSDPRGSAEYRREMSRVMTRRALQSLAHE
jgi:carbon-monoxide dehydrogenase medium subunit